MSASYSPRLPLQHPLSPSPFPHPFSGYEDLFPIRCRFWSNKQEAAVSKSHGCNNRIFIEDLSVKESVQSRVPHDEEVPMMHLWSNYTPVPKAQRRP
ncbi:unnamed protein product [Penicillium roqueforti FM164]|uniref:Str. FM013 n=2 Tax=Penicillium TaxID=5073 RepID=A0A0G4PY55_PENC3|nr:unnamed protein product [Penicillium roqueforti FM164]CRL31403.1 unnamed protein product [Penicillium camemberti]